MKIHTKRYLASILCLALVSTLAACKYKTNPEQNETEPAERTIEINPQQKPQQPGTDRETIEESALSETSADSALNPTEMASKILIKDQTFEVTLPPLGKVTFASFKPEDQKNSFADVIFEIQRDGKTIESLEGIEKDNNRMDRKFHKVEAVSFPDYNGDGYSDIIIICSYLPINDTAESSGESEARIYSGNIDGVFTLERELTNIANSAVAEKTVKSILGFMGVGQEDREAGTDGWQQAYIDFLQAQDPLQWQGYNLIYIDNDNIPELVEVGNSEAIGCRILTYSNGVVNENPLSRLYFTYIEGENLLCNSEGNMDYYYDLVYSIEDGLLEQIAAGYYGAKDNSQLELDENGNIIYQYQWNGTVMTQEEYNQKLNTVYNTEKSKEGYTYNEILSIGEVIQVIRGM